MSGLPSMRGVRRLKVIARNYRELCEELYSLSTRIRIDSKRHNEVESLARLAQRALVDQLSAMDCAQNGNYGWEYRICSMLGEFAIQTPSLEEETTHADSQEYAEQAEPGNG